MNPMSLYRLEDRIPQIDPTAWVAPSAVLIGLVECAENASVWWNAVLRGDNEPIVIGPRTNVQDGCVFHTDPGAPLILEQTSPLVTRSCCMVAASAKAA